MRRFSNNHLINPTFTAQCHLNPTGSDLRCVGTPWTIGVHHEIGKARERRICFPYPRLTARFADRIWRAWARGKLWRRTIRQARSEQPGTFLRQRSPAKRTTFFPGKGLRIDDSDSYLRYGLKQTITNGKPPMDRRRSAVVQWGHETRSPRVAGRSRGAGVTLR